MSDAGVNITFTIPQYDYSSYYDYPDDIAPCSSVSMKYFSKVFVAILYSLVFILGFIGNGLVVCVLVKHRNQANLTDICLFNLALSDLLFVIVLPFFSHYIVVGQWIFGDFMCRFTSGSHTAGFFSSIFFMVVMTLDRYMVIMHAHKTVGYRTMKAGLTLTVFVWILSLCVSLPVFIFTKVTNESYGYGCSTSQDEYWTNYDLFTTNVLGLVIPLLVMVVCYSRIIPRLVNMRTVKRHRAVKLIIAIMVVFFLFWAPYNISRFLKFLQSKNMLPLDCTWDQNITLAITVTEAIAYTHCCLNPVIYAFVGQKFMKRVLQMLKNWVPGICRNLPESSFRKSSVVSRSSDATSTFIM
ncbi:C-C chemokine receptor type 5-like isoform X3 [Acanthochromis polyacanthus]|uniref:C-C chemokine receptor type 5-like isoform X2 n=1 Tax=Acanthochromis polyacanthus TaxID=80966 RepID=UPI0022343866|nr:C-C chemokine receptor type 5-like isoform X2 [Acanthochromis polyacanthus]XP_051812968.1 C-C chemokine receptor type 5-like isoform X3 [Acanthochromis polyacanthus]XP_051812969.1 C-C chemokine receptor type 5-like isoform X3 [Acanthochromis polyacanthus]XP_051812970.1 C-C chemokine receptor type 5-like isoform X3 [Acanthochromis polyacanthus]XP_051812971.1 C-C chemokine receptor type 5-like isoform X3 [Acanthochromis polyacanthus]XP_051812972.1 C-C chemokine receptor type 5-like isoform X3